MTQKAPVTRRVVGLLMQKVMGIAVGFEPAFIQEMVITHGALEVGRWMGASVKVMEEVQAHFGGPRGQLLLSFAAVWHGCDFCSTGHLLACDMMRFEEDGSLYPLTGDVLKGLLYRSDEELLQAVRTILVDHPEDLALLERQNALRLGASIEDEDDRYLVATLATWEWITDCSVPVGAPEVVPPLDPRISRDKALQRRYAAARSR